MRHAALYLTTFLTIAAPLHAQDLPQATNEWFTAGAAAVEARAALVPNTNRARNIILLIGDGNGVAANYGARLFAGQAAGGLGDDFNLAHDTLPYAALVKTYSTNGQTPDSAPTASAMMTGIKTANDLINVTDVVDLEDCAAVAANSVTTLPEIMAANGLSVGIVSTARITHATPAAVYAQTASRDFEDNSDLPEGCTQQDIAVQLLEEMRAGVVDIALGGGRRHFLPAETVDDEGENGRRTDGRNLIAEAAEFGAQYAWNAETAAALTTTGNAPILGLFETSHMEYEADRTDEPTLAAMTATAITALSSNENGYFLMVEAGRIDHALHAGDVNRTFADGVALSEAVQMALDMTNAEDTLIIVTADHDHSLQFNGYCGRGSPINGLCMEIDPNGTTHLATPTLAADGKPYTVAGFVNGPGSLFTEENGYDAAPRPALTAEEVTTLGYLPQASVPLESETHSGVDVAAYANGPWAHLIDGTMEQNEIFHVMNYALNASK